MINITFILVAFLGLGSTLESTNPPFTVPTVAGGVLRGDIESTHPPLRGNLQHAEWRLVSRRINFYDSVPESIRSLVRREIDEFDVLANPAVYPQGSSAANYTGTFLNEEDAFDLS